MKTCAFYTLGCKVNQYETQSIRESFIRAGYKELDFSKSCDIYIVNTCTVTAKTDRESRRLIREAHKRNPFAKVVVTGCYAELDEREIKNIPGNHMIVKNKDKDKIAGLINSQITPRASNSLSNTDVYTHLAISDFKDRTKAFLKVQDGCSNFCSYCKVPLVRGRSRSRSIESTLEEARRLIAKGFKELVLTGVCLGAWGEDLSPGNSLDGLLGQLIKLEGDFRIRLSSIEPKYVTGRLISLMKSSPRLCRHLHVPFQSGDDEILGLMNRPYTVKEYMNIVEMARHSIPEVSITTDIMVGFPREREANFRNTYKFVEKIKPSRVHIFSYSKREGTAAAMSKETVPKSITKERFNRLKDLTSKISYRYRKSFLRKKTDVLVETDRDKDTGLLKGYDDKYIKILLDGEEQYRAKIVSVKIHRVDKERTFGAISQN